MPDKPTVELNRCLEHKVHNCAQCWLTFLRRLGDLCVVYYAEKQELHVNVLRGGQWKEAQAAYRAEADSYIAQGTGNVQPQEAELSFAGGQRK